MAKKLGALGKVLGSWCTGAGPLGGTYWLGCCCLTNGCLGCMTTVLDTPRIHLQSFLGSPVQNLCGKAVNIAATTHVLLACMYPPPHSEKSQAWKHSEPKAMNQESTSTVGLL